jgi:hypothetical protein
MNSQKPNVKALAIVNLPLLVMMAIDFIKEFFKAIIQGRTDYERSAMPICLQRTSCQ